MNTKVRETCTDKQDNTSATSGKKTMQEEEALQPKCEIYQCVEERLMEMKVEKERVCMCVYVPIWAVAESDETKVSHATSGEGAFSTPVIHPRPCDPTVESYCEGKLDHPQSSPNPPTTQLLARWSIWGKICGIWGGGEELDGYRVFGYATLKVKGVSGR